MIYKPFKNREVSMLGLGCLRFPLEAGSKNRIDRGATEKVIDAAFRNGINYFDTALIYQDGDSERVLGELLTKYPRESYMLATKFNPDAGLDIETAFMQELERCRTEYFDVYMFHNVDESHMDKYMSHPEYLEFMQEMKKQGKVRNIGFSSHACPENLEKFLNWYDGFDMALIQVNFLDWKHLNARRQYEILTEHNIPVWVMEPLKGGNLLKMNEEAVAILEAAAPGRTIPEWGFRFLMRLENVHTVLSGMSSVEMIGENAGTFSEMQPLTDEETDVLMKAAQSIVGSMGVPCSACRYCCPTCPAELDIPLLLKGYNELRFTNKGNWRVSGLKDAAGPEACLQCGECMNHCPQKIDIPDAMQKYAALRAKK